jgi:hypothetical protein
MSRASPQTYKVVLLGEGAPPGLVHSRLARGVGARGGRAALRAGALARRCALR